MSEKPILEASIKGLGSVFYAEKPYDEALAMLKPAKPITLRDLAYARIKEGYNSSLSGKGSYVKQGIIYIKKENPLFVFDSPIISSAVEATENHRKGEEFTNFDVKKYLEIAEEDKKKHPSKRRVLISATTKSYSIPTNRFNEDEIALLAFKDISQEYGDFLRNSRFKINEMRVCFVNNEYVNEQTKPFERQLWLGGLGSDSRLSGYGRSLDYDSGARGVRRESGEASAQKISESYTLKQITQALKQLKLSGLEKQILNALKK